MIVCRNDRGLGYEKELQDKGNEAKFIKTDLSKVDQIEAAAKIIEKKYGHVDALINNVGVNDGAGLDALIDDFMYSLKLIQTSCPKVTISKSEVCDKFPLLTQDL